MGSLINRIYSSVLSPEKFLKKIKYNEQGYYVHNSNGKQNYKVSVVIPVYNSEETIEKTIESIINQTIGFENIEVLLIDDKSTDNSRIIIWNYAKKYSNIVPVFLQENTGSPAKPRNLGIKFATGTYITFIDSDDWFHNEGLKVLYDILEKTGDNYAIGKTLQVTDNRIKIVGEYNNCETRYSIDPCSIPHLFQHLGPTARMMRTKFIKENDFKFPNMKFAEDKQFFIDVLVNCPTISTTTAEIYYANRLKDNKSLTTTTTIFEKTDTNIAVIKYVIQKQLPERIERMVLNRLYEFDCITRLFNREHFLKSKNKEKYYEKFREVLETTKNLRYDFTENFFESWHKVLVNLFIEERFDDIVKLIKWSLREVTKQIVIKDEIPYYQLPFEDYQLAEIEMLGCFKSAKKLTEKLVLQINVYGSFIDQIESFVIRQRTNELNQIELPIKHIEKNLFEVDIPYEKIASLSSASYAMFIKFSKYKKLFIKMDTRKLIKYNKKKIDFYTTVADNFGLSID